MRAFNPKCWLRAISGGFLLAVLFPNLAHALYLDPGTGSLILQVVAAGLLTVLLMFRNSWLWVKRFVGRLLRGGSPNRDSANADPDR